MLRDDLEEGVGVAWWDVARHVQSSRQGRRTGQDQSQAAPSLQQQSNASTGCCLQQPALPAQGVALRQPPVLHTCTSRSTFSYREVNVFRQSGSAVMPVKPVDTFGVSRAADAAAEHSLVQVRCMTQ